MPRPHEPRLREEFEHIRQDMMRLTGECVDLLRGIHPQHEFSARNLLHHMALRSHDLRPLQARLAAVGLSSLGRAESNVMAAVDAVSVVLQRLTGPCRAAPAAASSHVDPAAGQRLLDAHANAVFGPRPAGRGVAIMVTMPTEAADDYTLIWATQVLETLAKEGLPSRAEVTDAAMAHRAECVMLNKGPYIAQAVKVLDDILRRMHGHQAKKRPMLRELRLVSSFRKAQAVAHLTAGTRGAT